MRLFIAAFAAAIATSSAMAQDAPPAQPAQQQPQPPPMSYPEILARAQAEQIELGRRLQIVSYAFQQQQDELKKARDDLKKAKEDLRLLDAKCSAPEHKP